MLAAAPMALNGQKDCRLHFSWLRMNLFSPGSYHQQLTFKQYKIIPIMNELKKEDIKQEVFDLYDDYAHNRVNRRDFMQKLSVYAVGGVTATSLMSFLMPDYQTTAQVKTDDPGLKSEYIHYDSPKGGGKYQSLVINACGCQRETRRHCDSA